MHGKMGFLALLAALSGGCKKGGNNNSQDDTGTPVVEGCAVSPSPQLTRLTHVQYDNSVRDLLGFDIEPSSSFIPDAGFSGFDNNAEGLTVTSRLVRDYQRAAEEIAEEAYLTGIDELVTCDEEGEGELCARKFIGDFVSRAYRRPLTDDEWDRYVALYDAADGLYDTGSAFEQGIRLIIEATLQSPHFQYRVELSESGSGTTHALDGYEIAAKLATLLWNSIPDPELLEAAEDGDLATAAGIEEQARRMLADPRAEQPVADFHQQWLHMDEYEDLSRDEDLYPDFDPDLAPVMEAETQELIRHVIFEWNGDYEMMLTEPVSFVNDDLAALYDIEGDFGDELELVDLDPDERAGILTNLGFLAAHAYTDKTRPFTAGCSSSGRSSAWTCPTRRRTSTRPSPTTSRSSPPATRSRR